MYIPPFFGILRSERDRIFSEEGHRGKGAEEKAKKKTKKKSSEKGEIKKQDHRSAKRSDIPSSPDFTYPRALPPSISSIFSATATAA